MPKLAANISLLFTELPFPARIQAAAQAGFRGVECLFPYGENADDLAAALETADVKQILFNAPPGDWDAGERGIAALPGRIGEFRDGLKTALTVAERLGCHQIHVMAGIIPDHSQKAQYVSILSDNLKWAAEQAAARNITILLEPLNPFDVPGYLYSRTGEVCDILDHLGLPNIKLQLDLYHRQMTEGRLVEAIDRYFPYIGHIQIAGVPGRHEPSPSEINTAYLFDYLDSKRYDGWIGCEYHPRADSLDGLGWAKTWLSPQ